MKTKEELNDIKKEVKNISKKLSELTEDELKQVIGGNNVEFVIDDQSGDKEYRIYGNDVEKEFKPNYPTGSDR